MGWWQISDVESGQIDWDSENNSGEVNGDVPVDLMYGTIEEIIKEYERDWGRKPTRNELQATFNFVVNPLFDDE